MKNIVIIENHIISTNTVRQKLTSVLIEKGYNVTVLSVGTEKELARAREKGFNVIDIGSSNTNPLDILKYMANIRKALIKTRADVCLTFTMRPAIWGNIVTKSLNIPTITNITGIGPLAESKSLPYRVARTMYKFVLKKTAKVFFQNQDDKKIFLDKKFVNPEKVEVIPGSGVDYQHYQPMPKSHVTNNFVFLFISRLIKDKGILEFVEAAKIVQETHKNVVFQVVGPYYSLNLKDNIITEKEIIKWVEQGLVNYLGAAEDVRPYIADADCVVLPSYREGISGVLLESGSMEKPCITTDTTGCRDVIVDGVTGYICRVKDARDLADKMIKMINLSEEERQAMGKAARDIMKKKFAKEIIIDAYLDAISAATA